MNLSTRGLLIAPTLFLTIIGVSSEIRADEPDAEVNLVTGNIETVDLGSQDLVRHVVDSGPGGGRTSTTISASAGANPRISIRSDSGDSYVVWGQDLTGGSGIFLRAYDLGGSSWNNAKLISEPWEDSAFPEIVRDDDDEIWVVWQIDTGSGTDIAVINGITDGVDPWELRSILASSTATGDVDVRVHTEESLVWVSWVDSSSDVGWVDYDAANDTWSTPGYEDYSSSDVEAAREEIRETVLGL